MFVSILYDPKSQKVNKVTNFFSNISKKEHRVSQQAALGTSNQKTYVKILKSDCLFIS